MMFFMNDDCFLSLFHFVWARFDADGRRASFFAVLDVLHISCRVKDDYRADNPLWINGYKAYFRSLCGSAGGSRADVNMSGLRAVCLIMLALLTTPYIQIGMDVLPNF